MKSLLILAFSAWRCCFRPSPIGSANRWCGWTVDFPIAPTGPDERAMGGRFPATAVSTGAQEQGLVVIGVHSPEFAYVRDICNGARGEPLTPPQQRPMG